MVDGAKYVPCYCCVQEFDVQSGWLWRPARFISPPTPFCTSGIRLLANRFCFLPHSTVPSHAPSAHVPPVPKSHKTHYLAGAREFFLQQLIKESVQHAPPRAAALAWACCLLTLCHPRSNRFTTLSPFLLRSRTSRLGRTNYPSLVCSSV